jgi:hypothetical protein
MDLAIKAEKQGSKDVVEKSDIVFIKLLTLKIQGIHNQHLGEERYSVKANEDVLQADPESV